VPRSGMDENASGSVTAAAAGDAGDAGRNATAASTSLVQTPSTTSVLVFALVNSATTLVCACLTAVCVLAGLGLAGYRRRRAHLLHDRLASAADVFWSFEADIERLLRSVVTESMCTVVVI